MEVWICPEMIMDWTTDRCICVPDESGGGGVRVEREKEGLPDGPRQEDGGHQTQRQQSEGRNWNGEEHWSKDWSHQADSVETGKA